MSNETLPLQVSTAAEQGTFVTQELEHMSRESISDTQVKMPSLPSLSNRRTINPSTITIENSADKDAANFSF